MKILIVDDQYQNRKLLKDILKHYGECDLVSNGEEAVDLFSGQLQEEEPYDLVFLDIMMPGMDGLTALKYMREEEEEAGVPGATEAVIVMVTALNSPQQVIYAYFTGRCTDYMHKPITCQRVIDLLHKYDLIPEEMPQRLSA